ncbi:hypothetical protein BDZ45DRAFT_763944 [Acephala macrosclerotiorum]|nr:hypothetical protein BDZ45DRAFT_763944 [Acephala macrosclerotiorum]
MEKPSSQHSSNHAQLSTSHEIEPVDEPAATYPTAAKRLQAVGAALEEEMGSLNLAYTLSNTTKGLEKQIHILEADLINASKEKDEAVSEADELRTRQTHHEEELAKEKANRLEHVRKVKESLVVDHAKDIAELKAKHEKERATFQKSVDEPRLQKKIAAVQASNKTLSEEIQATKKVFSEEVEGLKKSQDEAEKRCEYLEEKLSHASNLGLRMIDDFKKQYTALHNNCLVLMENHKESGYYTDVISLYEEEMARLLKKVDQLEKDRDLKAPLVEIGVKIRQRYMVREGTTGRRSEQDQLVIEGGNDAAHKKNEAADRAVFDLGRWSEEKYDKLFKKVYVSDLTAYAEAVRKYERVLEYWSWLDNSHPTKCTVTHYSRAALLIEVMLLVIGPKEKRHLHEDDELDGVFDVFFDRLEDILCEIGEINKLGELEVDDFYRPACAMEVDFQWAYVHDKKNPNGFSFMTVTFPEITRPCPSDRYGRYPQTAWSVTYLDPAENCIPVKKQPPVIRDKTYATVAASKNNDGMGWEGENNFPAFGEEYYGGVEDDNEAVGEELSGQWEVPGN